MAIRFHEIVKTCSYYDLGALKPRGDTSILFDEDCLKEIDKKWITSQKVVLVVGFNLKEQNNRVLRPLREAHKRGGTFWEKAYQAVKHDRYGSLVKGNVKALLHALAALYLLNLYYKKDTWITSYQDVNKLDMSCGSKIFAVNPPRTSGDDNSPLWDNGNTPVNSDSPYIVTYTDAGYKKIKKIQEKEKNELNDFLIAQPELTDKEFIQQLLDHLNQGKVDTVSCEIAVFRLNKKIPASLPFEERKRLLLTSEEWFTPIHINNKHTEPQDITEENIQSVINSVGRQAGLDMELRYMRFRWLPMALNDNICEVKIPR